MTGAQTTAPRGDARRRLSPSSAGIPLAHKAHESARLARSYVERTRRPIDFSWVFADLAEYDEMLRSYAGVPLARARVFEIGFGARPYRMSALHSSGVDAAGVDAEVPVLSGRPAELLAAHRANGLERTVKSLVRRVAFDPSERAAFARELRSRGLEPRLDRDRLLVSDAADVTIPPCSLDLVVSEEVFQSVERTSLERIVPRMAGWLRPGGLALIRPTVFTGILGGVLQEWSKWTLAHPPRRRRSEPWEHLRKRRFHANTHVNELTRADYRRLLDPWFEVIEERVRFPDLGREHLTPAVRAELERHSDDELFSNMVLFVARARA